MGLLQRLFSRSPEDPGDELIRWLSGTSLDDRRLVAGVLYGGPFSLRFNKWVLSQPDCDTGTAGMLLWEFGMPYAVVKRSFTFPLEQELHEQLIAFITERWRNGAFADAVFEYDPRLQVTKYRRALGALGLKGQNPLGIPDDAFKPIPGRRPVGSEASDPRRSSALLAILQRVRLADLAAINPKDWEHLRRKNLGLA
jgi:hypothetical protein